MSEDSGIPDPYSPNETDWPVGSIVIHSADAKNEFMLMRVIAKYEEKNLDTENATIQTMYVTEYLYPDKYEKLGKKYVKREVFRNYKQYLLDPDRFNISVLSALSSIYHVKRLQEVFGGNQQEKGKSRRFPLFWGSRS